MNPEGLAVAALVCFVVGLLIGWSGVAGFLLPIFYTGYFDLPVYSALMLSFFCFFLSGCIGSLEYMKRGQLLFIPSFKLGIGSLPGAVIGILISRHIPGHVFALILYTTVFLSGLSIMCREFFGRFRNQAKYSGQINRNSLIPLGFVTAIICTLSGAGGPILVMPLLLLFGWQIRASVAAALFDSVFIALPSVIGYSVIGNAGQVLPLFFVSGISHSAGVLIGGKTAGHIPVRPLKICVAVFAVLFSAFRLTSFL